MMSRKSLTVFTIVVLLTAAIPSIATAETDADHQAREWRNIGPFNGGRGTTVTVKGPQGSLSRVFTDSVSFSLEDGVLSVDRADDLRQRAADDQRLDAAGRRRGGRVAESRVDRPGRSDVGARIAHVVGVEVAAGSAHAGPTAADR